MDQHNRRAAVRNITAWLIDKYLTDLEYPERINRGVDGKGNALYSAKAWREKVGRLLDADMQAQRPDLAERARALGISDKTELFNAIEEA